MLLFFIYKTRKKSSTHKKSGRAQVGDGQQGKRPPSASSRSLFMQSVVYGIEICLFSRLPDEKDFMVLVVDHLICCLLDYLHWFIILLTAQSLISCPLPVSFLISKELHQLSCSEL